MQPAKAKINVEIMKQFNILSVLNVIRTQGPISRVEIAERIHLSRPSVSEIVRELICNGWVRELPASRTHRGRRPIPLELNPTGRYILGVSIVAFQLTVVLADLTGNVVAETTKPLQPDCDPKFAMDLVSNLCEALISRHMINRAKILGVGIAMHGMVDPELGRSLYAPHLGWRNVDVGPYIASRLGLQTFVEADNNATALAELWFGAGGHANHFVAMVVDYGIGAGIIYNGQLYRGAHHIDGQIGHTSVDEDGPLCACGNFGCLEVMASEPAIARMVTRRIRSGEPSKVFVRSSLDLRVLDIKAIYRAAHMGDSVSVQVLQTAAKYIGLGMTTLINILNPNSIVLSGGVTQVANVMLPIIQDIIRARAFDQTGKETPVEVSPLGKQVYPVGAIALVLEHVFRTPEIIVRSFYGS